MKHSFKQFLLEKINLDEKFGNTGHEHGGGSHIKADIVDLLRSHTSGGSNEILYSSLKQDKEKEAFDYYFNKLNQRYTIDAVKDAKQFRNVLTVIFHSTKIKAGHFIKVSATFADEETARTTYEDLMGKYQKKI